eukprot:TRINITY_DN1677_c0_g1_i8.p2 TRINITY_DN1677_c0_g1~~TRINITY_DN1677_c0_g1_i8.p2  ORF type:complete len:250 (+),score=58.92 TRINITY_DN1677_c0_g1_i8:131-880(+)
MASRLLARRFASTAAAATEKKPINVAVTGAAGAIGYALLMRIASGDMLGPNQPVNLQLIETEPGMKPLSGVTMELADCAFPLLRSVQSTTDLEAGFGDAGLAILVGARPRSKGMERGDLLTANASIFAAQGAALNAAAARDVSVLVVGNPANTNALVASANAPDLSPAQFYGHDPPRPIPRRRGGGGQDGRPRAGRGAGGYLGQPLGDTVPRPNPRDRAGAGGAQGHWRRRVGQKDLYPRRAEAGRRNH